MKTAKKQDLPEGLLVEKFNALICLGVEFARILTRMFEKRGHRVVVYPFKERGWDVSKLSPCENALLGLYSNGLAVLEAMLVLCRGGRIFVASILMRTVMEISMNGSWILKGANAVAINARAESFVAWRDCLHRLRVEEMGHVVASVRDGKISSHEEINKAMQEMPNKFKGKKKAVKGRMKKERISKGWQGEDSYPEVEFWKTRDEIAGAGASFAYGIMSDAVHGVGDWVASEKRYPGHALWRVVERTSYLFQLLIYATAEACGVEDDDMSPVRDKMVQLRESLNKMA